MIRPHGAVIDASVVVKLLVPEDDSDSAHRLFDDLAGARVAAPELLLTEVTSALWLRVRRGLLALEVGEAQLGFARRISQGFEVWPLSALVFPAWRLATSLGITVYDACYVAVAEMQGVPLVTADRKLVRRCAALPVSVIHLESIA